MYISKDSTLIKNQQESNLRLQQGKVTHISHNFLQIPPNPDVSSSSPEVDCQLKPAPVSALWQSHRTEGEAKLTIRLLERCPFLCSSSSQFLSSLAKTSPASMHEGQPFPRRRAMSNAAGHSLNMCSSTKAFRTWTPEPVSRCPWQAFA